LQLQRLPFATPPESLAAPNNAACSDASARGSNDGCPPSVGEGPAAHGSSTSQLRRCQRHLQNQAARVATLHAMASSLAVDCKVDIVGGRTSRGGDGRRCACGAAVLATRG
jgi:hypothetical protein